MHQRVSAIRFDRMSLQYPKKSDVKLSLNSDYMSKPIFSVGVVTRCTGEPSHLRLANRIPYSWDESVKCSYIVHFGIGCLLALLNNNGEGIMAWYIAGSKVVKSTGENSWWKKIFSPGEEVPTSGIYMCTGCEKEITSNEGDPFPPQNHHQHTVSQGAIRWRLNVRTNTEGKQ